MSEICSAEEFRAKVLEAQGKVLVDFSATWCGPCQRLAPILAEVAEELAGQVAVYTVDVDECPTVAANFGVSCVPTLIVFEDGQVKRQTMGLQPKQNLLALVG